MQSHDGKGLGCWLGHGDPRSRAFTHRATLTTLHTVLHTAAGPILDQVDVGACVGFTDADILNTAKFRGCRYRRDKRARYLTNRWGFDFYDKATDLDEWTDENWPPDDTGTSVLAGAKALKADGFIDRYEWAWDMQGFLAALQRQAVMLGTLWTSGMSDPDASGLVRPTGELVGGHAYMAFGMNVRSQRVRCRNHWTKDWGMRGDFYIGFEDMEWLIGQQGEVLVPIPV